MAQVKNLTVNGVDLLDLIYPVGTIFTTENDNFDPNDHFNGTWERIKGKVLVGVDEDDSSFSSSGLTGGEKNHTLTTSEMPSHNHNFKNGSHTWYWGTGSGTVYASTNVVSGSVPSPYNYISTVHGVNSTTNNSGGVLLTTTCLRIMLHIFGEELHKRIFLRSKIIRRNIYG